MGRAPSALTTRRACGRSGDASRLANGSTGVPAATTTSVPMVGYISWWPTTPTSVTTPAKRLVYGYSPGAGSIGVHWSVHRVRMCAARSSGSAASIAALVRKHHRWICTREMRWFAVPFPISVARMQPFCWAWPLLSPHLGYCGGRCNVTLHSTSVSYV